MKSFAVIRADTNLKVHTTLLDLRRYGRIVFAGPPKSMSPDYADEILGKVINRPLKNKCNSAAVVSLNTIPSVAIGKLTKIHPPAHVVIVSSKHEIYDELVENFEILPEFEARKPIMIHGEEEVNVQEITADY
ncbi:MAG: hypothetical protein C00003105_00597 [ANME-2 cluster archaeon HR1]|nr:MAG: hypothetical protein C5S41_07400 [ANME-2 cluster archaeon]KAF5424586.1 hypothetical protein C5S42_12885 [ANME-2 cluster archaeon]PPA78446.1 MAG: hypothetical protein C00003105_00597 [ANME-2 cluster archaeon HR1]